jgi:molybdenum cofactor cytidylyltransferase
MHNGAVMSPARIVAVVPAAGLSTRFGAMKLLADVDGAPLIARTLASLLDAGIARVVVVVRQGDAFEGLLADPRVATVVNPDPARGMFSSIQTGLAVVGGDVVLVLPADMPFVAAETATAVAARAVATTSLVVPVHHGRRGHPIAIPRPVCDALLPLEPTTTLKDGLARVRAPVTLLEVTDAGVLRDVDVPADLR